MSPTDSVRQIRAADLAVDDRLVLAFPRDTTIDQVPGLLGDGWFIADVDQMDRPAEMAEHRDTGQPLTETDVAARHALPVTFKALGQTTVLLALALPDDTEHVQELSRFITVRVTE